MPRKRARHVDDVVAILRAEQAQIPVEHALLAVTAKMPAQASLVGVGDDLLQRRVADQRIVEEAGPHRIGAAEFQGRRRPIGFRIAAIGRDIRRDLEGRADHRVESAVPVIAVEIIVVAERIAQADLSDIETAAEGDRQPRCHIESVRCIDAGVQRLREHTHRRDIAGRLVDDHADALHERPLIGIDRSELARRVELGAALIHACPDDKTVVLSKNLGRGRRLQ